MTTSDIPSRTEVPDFVFRAALLGVEGVTEVILVRHAEQAAAPDAANAIEAALTERGRRQGEALAARLTRKKLDAVISSPVRRAVETAEILAARARLTVEIDDDLREIDHHRGLPPGVDPRAHLGPRQWDRIAAAYARRLTFDSIPFWERGAEVRTRARRAVASAASRFPGGRVALVSHNPVIGAFLAAVLRARIDFPVRLEAAATATVAAKAGVFILRSANDTSHLAALEDA